MKRQRIAVMTRPVDNRATSGSGKHLIELLKAVLELNHGFDLTFVHNIKNDHFLYKSPGVNELLIPRNPLKASKVLRQQNFDLIHYCPVSLMSPMWGIKAKKTGTIHNAEPALIPAHFPLWAVVHEYVGCRPMSRKLDAVATVSETSKEFLSRFYGMDPGKFYITYNGFNSSFCFLDDYKKREREPFLFHISKFSLRKNPWVLLESFGIIHKKYPELRLKIAGTKWDNDEVSSKLDEWGIRDYVDFLGFASEETVIDHLNRASAFVFPSVCEGFGIPNIEAQACGCPVVTTAAFAIPEVVGDGAVVVDDIKNPRAFAEGIDSLFSLSVEDRIGLIERGLENVKRFSWEESAGELVKMWREVLKEV